MLFCLMFWKLIYFKFCWTHICNRGNWLHIFLTWYFHFYYHRGGGGVIRIPQRPVGGLDKFYWDTTKTPDPPYPPPAKNSDRLYERQNDYQTIITSWWSVYCQNSGNILEVFHRSCSSPLTLSIFLWVYSFSFDVSRQLNHVKIVFLVFTLKIKKDGKKIASYPAWLVGYLALFCNQTR